MNQETPIAALLHASVELAKRNRLIAAQRETIAILFHRNRALEHRAEMDKSMFHRRQAE